MLPLRDNQPRTTTPYVNYSIIAVNLAVFAYEMWLAINSPQDWYAFLRRYAEIPHHFQLAFTGSPEYSIAGAFLTIFTSMFLHAGIVHALGNMWFLWIFGDNIEDHFGHAVYLVFYLFCGFIASMAQLFANPTSDIPSLGASGAIAGVMGAFLLRYPQARVQVYWGYTVFWMPAIGTLFYWFALQVIGQIATQVASSRVTGYHGGIAYWAHLGGFLTGLIMVKVIPGRTEYEYGAWVKPEPASKPETETSTPAQ